MPSASATASAAGITTAPEWSAPPKSSSSWAWARTPLTSAAAAAVVVREVPQMAHGPAFGAKPSAADSIARASAVSTPASAAPSRSSNSTRA